MIETKVLWGKELYESIVNRSREEIEAIKRSGYREPCLAVILVGNDPASEIYVSKKHEACKKAGIKSLNIKLPEDTSFDFLKEKIEELNSNDEVDGILLQLPLPQHLRDRTVELIESISPDKDVDGFNPVNAGLVSIGDKRAIVPCTPKGIIKLLDHYGISVEGMDIVIVGASNIVGKPLANILINLFATVTVCHIKTKCLQKHTKNADMVISATGVPHLIKRDMVREGAIVIDVGISRVDNRVVGDVDFESMMGHALAVTPVPGGVGPLTVAMLIENTIICYKRRNFV